MLTFGCLSAVGFAYVGVRARTPAWWIAGLAYTVLATTCFFLGPELPEDSVASDVTFLVLMVVWITSIVHALVINGTWLRWRAGYVPWHAQPVGWPAPAASGGPLPAPLQGLVPEPEQFYATRPGTTLSPPTPTPTPTPTGSESAGTAPTGSGPADTAPTGFTPGAGVSRADTGSGLVGRQLDIETATGSEPTGERLDVNTATVRQLAALPGFGADRAARVISERQARRGFADVADFADAAGLAPHELVRVRDRVFCGPGAGAVPVPRHGRILDV